METQKYNLTQGSNGMHVPALCIWDTPHPPQKMYSVTVKKCNQITGAFRKNVDYFAGLHFACKEGEGKMYFPFLH